MVFLTVCTAKRKPLLANTAVQELLVDVWCESDLWLVGRYVLMPDHLHLFCAPACVEHPSVRKWAQYWKSRASTRWPNRLEQPVWQSDVWDRQLRTGESYSEKWAYVRNNPVRHGLVKNAEDWPYQGELNSLLWHD
ncbi:REP-associated tyrosine transposase [Coraliomargarita parva]|uniref:REP-associated tyrosine transposase n=1 Tax=Coraliomargarita parva TaxID=3014050 RepID=UPI003CE5C0F6